MGGARGVVNTLSTSVSFQQSDSSTSTAFSFMQNNYYTVTCKMDEKTKEFNAMIKGPNNPESVQNEFALSAKIKAGAEHTCTPPRALQQKISLDCSLARTAPSLTGFSVALPFSADLVATLEYSAAYIGHAEYIAKYAVRQSNWLTRQVV